jgi:hypothetical protein
VTLYQFGVLIVDEPGCLGRLSGVLGVGRLRAGRQQLQLNSGPVHQPQPGIELGAAASAEAAGRACVGPAQVCQQVDVVIGPIVRMHVDPHEINSPRSPG